MAENTQNADVQATAPEDARNEFTESACIDSLKALSYASNQRL